MHLSYDIMYPPYPAKVKMSHSAQAITSETDDFQPYKGLQAELTLSGNDIFIRAILPLHARAMIGNSTIVTNDDCCVTVTTNERRDDSNHRQCACLLNSSDTKENTKAHGPYMYMSLHIWNIKSIVKGIWFLEHLGDKRIYIKTKYPCICGIITTCPSNRRIFISILEMKSTWCVMKSILEK